MKSLKVAVVLAILTVFVSCKDKNKEMEKEVETTEIKEVEEVSEIKKVSFDLESRSESTAKGKVVFSEKDGIVSFNANLEGLTPGSHAIHIHEKSDCSAADGTSAGGHWNPTAQPHGKWGAADGYHKGDIGNFTADDSGNGFISMQTDEWCIGCDDPNKDILGKSIIVHQGEDDFTSQPSGAAGARVSCGGIIQ
tara:strand:+ start:105709 stop:106290 length:582 start_codon:yes stop_codon:yes gene_type:complete